MGEVIQLQGDHRLKIKDFLVNEETGLALDEKNIKVRVIARIHLCLPAGTK
jgi:translation initiation factor 1